MPIWEDVIPAEELARARRQKRTLGEYPALLVIDMTRRFTTDEWIPGQADASAEVIRQIKPVLAQARESGIPVIHISTQLRLTPAQKGQWGDIPSATDPNANQFHPELLPNPDEEVIYKIAPSAFLHTDLVSFLMHYRIDTLIIVGVSTSACVRATAVDSFAHNLTTVLPEECCGDSSPISHKVSLYNLHYKYAEVQPVAETMAYLKQVKPNPVKYPERNQDQYGIG